jgi:hypothetical protein
VSRFDAPTDEIVAYRAVSGLAVASLLAALAAPTAMLGTPFWLVPLLGLVLAGLALRQIARRAPALVGRKAALAAGLLSLVFAVAAPTHWLCYRQLLRREARQFAALWFDALRRGEPHKAHQLTIVPRQRLPLDDRLLDTYRKGIHTQEKLKTMIEQPCVRKLLDLGPQAQVRYYGSADQDRQDDRDSVELIYAVGYEERGEPKTFFVDMLLWRVAAEGYHANWQVARVAGREM